eukprot:403366363
MIRVGILYQSEGEMIDNQNNIKYYYQDLSQLKNEALPLLLFPLSLIRMNYLVDHKTTHLIVRKLRQLSGQEGWQLELVWLRNMVELRACE